MKRIKGHRWIILFSSMALMLVVNGCNPEYKRLEDATEKEYNDFMKWDAKQQQKKRDESPAFK